LSIYPGLLSLTALHKSLRALSLGAVLSWLEDFMATHTTIMGVRVRDWAFQHLTQTLVQFLVILAKNPKPGSFRLDYCLIGSHRNQRIERIVGVMTLPLTVSTLNI